MNNINVKSLVVPIILIILIGGAIFYFTKNKNTSAQPEESNNSLDFNSTIDVNDPLSGSSNVVSTFNDEQKDQVISDGDVYVSAIVAIRKPINQGFEDINQKLKYKTIFTDEDTKKAATDLKTLIAKAIDDIKKLKIDKKLDEANQKELESLTLLNEAVDDFAQMMYSVENEEKQKFYDLYNYKIDQSNSVLNNISVPK